MEIRVADHSDVAVVAELNGLLFGEDGGTRDPFIDLTWPGREGPGYFSALVSSADTVVFLAESPGGVAGYLAARMHPRNSMRTSSTAELESMFVRTEYRREHVGGALVEAFLRWAAARGAGRVAVTAYAANEGAVRFYRRWGFEPRTITLDRPLTGAG